jgi:eukaryotic-like serine/threonine-protein kinase
LQLGRYQILKQLATGDVADVLLARATGMEGFARHVVIKCIRPELATEQRLVESFLEEARIAAALHHQNVVQVHDIGEQEGRYFFAMEYVHGEEVRQLIAKVRERGEQVPLGHVIAVITATAAGLHHAHEQRNAAGEPLGLVHRDVCPANILLGYDGSVKLVDFGMARAALRSEKTASGSLKGKASYMSPEQCMGKLVDRRTDTFALGIVLYELATAQRLFKAANEFLTMSAIVEGSVPPPSTFRPDLPPALDEIVLRALAREPESRYQTAEDLRAALERFAIEHELRASNKALADYLTALFGNRLEPWHAESEVRAAADNFDNTSGKGLVAAPESNSGLIAKHAPRSTAPIMLAQTLAEEPADKGVDDEWADDEDHMRTEAGKPSQPMAAQLRNPDQEHTRNERRPAALVTEPVAPPASPISDDDDPYSRTVVAPPVFVEEEATIGQAEREAIAAAVLGTEPRMATATEVDDDAVATLNGSEQVADDAATLDGTGPGRPETELPPRAASEHIYVGPPAPRSPLVNTVLGTYRRSIIVGAAGGVLAVVIAVMAMRSCRSEAAPDVTRAAPGSAVTMPLEQATGHGSAR